MPAALLYGLAVHWRLYPIIYALPLLRHYALQRRRPQPAWPAAASRPPVAASPLAQRAWRAATAAAAGLVSPAGAAFGALSGGLFLGLAAAFYAAYGHEFLHETYLYHAGRTDPRHNFSPYFYPAYLASPPGASSAGAGAASGASSSSWDVGW